MKSKDLMLLAGAAVAVYWLLNRQAGAAPALGVSVRTTPQTRAYDDPMTPPAWLGGEDFYYAGGA